MNLILNNYEQVLSARNKRSDRIFNKSSLSNEQGIFGVRKILMITKTFVV